ncbi:DUF7511 domain-containing protein [Halalkalicoccus jeotgali]|uniref:DUF7511 domain-containing protein n=1 Tax=Halalkalicoccus jeotgali (strain DSM 18796 / CECT 7217 / JCM 14584 / KCTC 4019 / B3) TaxID=795797 RepID=D8J9Q7_HALJB|nr:hypothetical protein [Halalkalicoccus jeotgali]ADJ16396.1 hypothetical protein HacjB3_15085 [Halalkalicoccus jeotgali B3]ELY37130.1 hypothetical protein C497_10313 [Halalkalicoccus jeotgali B3]
MSTSQLSDDPGGSLRLITHEDGRALDRWTLAPTDPDDDQRYTAWISADPETLVDLETRR